MLNKKLVVSAIAFALVGSANAATVYDKDGNSLNVGGRVQADFLSVHASSDGKNQIEGSARLNIGGKAKITDGFSGIGFAEWSVSSESRNNGRFDTRYAYVGFDTDNFGSLVFGQKETSSYEHAYYVTDVYETFGFDGNYVTLYADGGRQEGQAIYSINVSGFDFGASFQTHKNATEDFDGINSGFDVGLGYTIEGDYPIHIGVAYNLYDASELDEGVETNYDAWAIGTGLSFGTFGSGFYTAATYQHVEHSYASGRSYAADGIEVLASYGYNNVTGILGYSYLVSSGDNQLGNITAEVQYAFNDNFKTYASAQFGVVDVENDSGKKETNDNKYVVGLQYNF
ncbi:MAG: porin [Succinivibrionaceae bacterium]